MKKKLLVTWGGVAGLALCGCGALAQTVYTIYPIPHEQVAASGTVAFSQQVNVVCEDGVDEITRQRVENILNEHGMEAVFTSAVAADKANILLGVNGSGGAADDWAVQMGVARDVFGKQGKYDRHCLSLTKGTSGWAQLLILGEHTDAVFFGLASFEQMLDKGDADMPCVNIYDYADLQSRGIVEGYYGYPYSVEVKKDLMRFMMRYKMNTYLYGAKSDPYHSNFWRDAYPDTLTPEQVAYGWLSSGMMREVAQVSKETKVNFIWAIHPGNDFLDSDEVIGDIMGKFDKMHDLGVRQFAVFVDDVGIPGSESGYELNADRVTELQESLVARYNTPSAAPADTVRPLHFVPQVYCVSFEPNAYKRKKFFNALGSIPSEVVVYTTGGNVWSVPNSGDLLTIKNDLGRNLAWWWNYPCNDNADARIYPMDMYSNFVDLPSVNNSARMPSDLQNGLGIVSNPMQQGEVAKIPLFGVADYAWNNAAFDNAANWNASFRAVVPADKAEAYQYLAGFLRYNDSEELGRMIAAYKASATEANAQAITEEMDKILEACDVLATLKESGEESDRLLYKDLSPWLLKLRAMAVCTKGLIGVAEMPDSADRWEAYAPLIRAVAALDTAEAHKAYALEGMGNSISVSVRAAQPSAKYLYPFITHLKEKCAEGLFETRSGRDVASFISNNKTAAGDVKSANGEVYIEMPQAVTLLQGEYVGFSLAQGMRLSEVEVGTSLSEDFAVLYSPNGKKWDLLRNGVAPDGYVKHVCVQNVAETAKVLRLGKDDLNVSLMGTKAKNVVLPQGNVYENYVKGNIVDGDYNTVCMLSRNQQAGDAYEVELDAAQPIHDVRVCMSTVNADYMRGGLVQISADGRTWTDLCIKGTDETVFSMDLPQVTRYSDEVAYCDFSCDGASARYVRLFISEPKTSNWLRIAEIEANKQWAKQLVCVDGEGKAIETLHDGLGYTGMNSAAKYVTYDFVNLASLKSVEIYQDASVAADAAEPAKVLLTRDGADWVEAARLTDYRQAVDLSGMPDAAAMRIEWQGKYAPLIYEVVEIPDAETSPEVGLKSVSRGFAGAVSFAIEKGSMLLESDSGLASVSLYSLGGAKLYGCNCEGRRQVIIPVDRENGRIQILKTVACGDASQTYKVLVD